MVRSARQFALELGEGYENVKREAAIGHRRIDLRAFPRQYLEPDVPGSDILDGVDQMAQVAAKANYQFKARGAALAHDP